MALLSWCWIIIECIIVQDGFLKWSYLKVFLNPFFLSLCQSLLWLRLLYLWLLRHLRLFYDTLLWVLSAFHKQLIRFVPSVREDATRVESSQRFDFLNLVVSREVHSSSPVFCSHDLSINASNFKVIWVQESEILEEDENEAFEECERDGVVVELLEEDSDSAIEDKSMEEDLELECQTSEEENSCADDGEDIGTLSTDTAGHINSSEEDDDETDSDDQSSHFSDLAPIDENYELYEQYRERMRWYDTLNQDRTLGLSMIMNQKTARSLHSSWDKMAEKRLRESIERDLELVYVAQSCLSWEALRHHHIRISGIAESADPRGGFRSDLCGDFQRFQVLLERFLEDERCDQRRRRRRRRRVMSFVQRRFELMSFLQVPNISGYNNSNREGSKGRVVGAGDVLKAIEKCTQVFYEYVKSDTQRTSWWGRLTSDDDDDDDLVQVEDPRDINLFVSLTDSLRKKEQLLKDIQQGKNNKYCWLKIRKPKQRPAMGEQQEMMMMIDLKLVYRVLQMPLVSSSQLKWCQHKLDGIHFKDGKMNYASLSSPFLFPSS